MIGPDTTLVKTKPTPYPRNTNNRATVSAPGTLDYAQTTGQPYWGRAEGPAGAHWQGKTPSVRPFLRLVGLKSILVKLCQEGINCFFPILSSLISPPLEMPSMAGQGTVYARKGMHSG